MPKTGPAFRLQTLTPMLARLLSVKDWEKFAEEESFNVEAMALCCRVSVRTLERFFRRELRKSPRSFVTALRYRRAAKLLQEGFSNKAIVELLGLAGETHFCRQFKKLYGVSPQNFVLISGSPPLLKSVPLLQSPSASAQSDGTEFSPRPRRFA